MKKSEREQMIEIAEAVSECIKTSNKDSSKIVRVNNNTRENKLDALVNIVNKYKKITFPDDTLHNEIEILSDNHFYLAEIIENTDYIEVRLSNI